jgi:hypothetical protein
MMVMTMRTRRTRRMMIEKWIICIETCSFHLVGTMILRDRQRFDYLHHIPRRNLGKYEYAHEGKLISSNVWDHIELHEKRIIMSSLDVHSLQLSRWQCHPG